MKIIKKMGFKIYILNILFSLNCIAQCNYELLNSNIINKNIFGFSKKEVNDLGNVISIQYLHNIETDTNQFTTNINFGLVLICPYILNSYCKDELIIDKLCEKYNEKYDLILIKQRKKGYKIKKKYLNFAEINSWQDFFLLKNESLFAVKYKKQYFIFELKK